MVGIKMLARHLEMSISTVSRALNDALDVSAATKKRVREAAEELGYVPNQSGRSLRRGSTGAIGFLLETRADVVEQSDNSISSVSDGVQTVLSRHHLDLVALLCPASENGDEYLRRMVNRGFVDGIILSNTRRVDSRIEFLSGKVPFVTFGRSMTETGQSWVDIDFEAIVTRSIERFISRGYRRIAITIPPGDLNYAYLILESARNSLAAHDLELEPDLIFKTFPTERGGYAIAGELCALENQPTGVVAYSAALVPGLYRGLAEHDRKIGRDIAIIGRDGPQSQSLSPKLTRFAESLSEIGIALGEALLASMPQYSDTYTTRRVRKLAPLTFIEGESDALLLGAKRSSTIGASPA